MATGTLDLALHHIDGKTAVTAPNPFERAFGYPRAVRKGPFIFVSGTTFLQEDGKVAFPNDAGSQAGRVFDLSVRAVEALGGAKKDIMRVRIFVAVSSYHLFSLMHRF